MSQDFLLPLGLNPHAANAHDIGGSQPIDRFDILVDYLDLPISGGQGGQCGQAQGGIKGFHLGSDALMGPGEAPEAFGKPWIDQKQFHGNFSVRRFSRKRQ
jgi:hypothetical protein